MLSSPTVADGILYIGSSDRYLYALNAADGALKWKFPTRGAIASSPAIDGGAVYFTSADGNLYAVDAAGGKLRWRFPTDGERRFTAPGIHGAIPRTETMPDPFDLFLSSPAVVDATVYFGSGDHNVYAVDAAFGKLKWKFATGNIVHASPAVAAGVVYIGSWDRYLYALDAATGRVRWKFQTGDDTEIYNQVGIASSAAERMFSLGSILFSPAIAAGVLYVGSTDGNVYAHR